MDPLSAIQNLPIAEADGLPYARLVRLPPKISPAEIQELPGAILPQTGTTSAASGDLGSVFGKLVDEVSSKQNIAGETVSGLLSGQNVSLHQAMVAMEEASISFQLLVEVRNKLLESYHELMRMQI